MKDRSPAIPKQDTMTAVINVNRNLFPPQFNIPNNLYYEVTVAENAPTGSYLVKVDADDDDIHVR